MASFRGIMPYYLQYLHLEYCCKLNNWIQWVPFSFPCPYCMTLVIHCSTLTNWTNGTCNFRCKLDFFFYPVSRKKKLIRNLLSFSKWTIQKHGKFFFKLAFEWQTLELLFDFFNFSYPASHSIGSVCRTAVVIFPHEWGLNFTKDTMVIQRF